MTRLMSRRETCDNCKEGTVSEPVGTASRFGCSQPREASGARKGPLLSRSRELPRQCQQRGAFVAAMVVQKIDDRVA
jgi:hypothetical protein